MKYFLSAILTLNFLLLAVTLTILFSLKDQRAASEPLEIPVAQVPEPVPASAKESDVPPAPENSAPVPENSAPVPENSVPTPENSAPTPENSAPAPENSAPVPENSAPVPENTTPAPENSAPTPENTTPTPENTTPTPENTTPAPENSAPVSENSAPVPENSAPAPENSAPTPENSAPARTKKPNTATERSSAVSTTNYLAREQNLWDLSESLRGDIEPPSLRHRLPNGYRTVELDERQTTEIYRIQEEYNLVMHYLSLRIKRLKAERDARIEQILTNEQRKKLAKKTTATD